jgi:hypothetical protein
MNGLKNRRTSILATVTGISVGIAGVLLLTRTPEVVFKTDTASNTTADVRGPGIPPAPGATQNAPPDSNHGAPTANLKKVANALHLNYKSVTVVVTAPHGLGLTNRVGIDLRYGSQGEHLAQTYDNRSGNRLLVNLPEGDGQKRRQPVVIRLSELAANGTVQQYEIKSMLELEPLYAISFSAPNFYLLNDCDTFGDSEPWVFWRFATNTFGDDKLSLAGGDTKQVEGFAIVYSEVGQSRHFGVPTFRFVERDPDPGGFTSKDAPPLETALVPGRSRTVKQRLVADGDKNCLADVDFHITYALHTYANLI